MKSFAEGLGAALSRSHAFAIFLAAYVATLTLFGTVAHGWGSLHHDMTEAWAWGQEFQLGYYKHPPVFAWVAGLWFQLMPRDNWSFTLLAALNAAAGLAGIWKIGTLLLDYRARWVAVLLLAATPLFSSIALKFNANTILLSLWPWTAYFFLRSLRSRSYSDGLLFGVMSGLALGGKYYSALLLASCLFASLIGPERRAYYHSSAPYLAIGAFLLTIAPHVWWLQQSGFPTITYAITKTSSPFGEIVARGAVAILVSATFLLPAVLIFALVWRDRWREVARRLSAAARHQKNAPLIVLALGPFALTLLACVLGHVRISAQYMVPSFFLVSVAALALSRITVTPLRLGAVASCVFGMMLVAVVTAPLAGYVEFERRDDWMCEPRKEAALEATRLWYDTFANRLEVVSGDRAYAQAISFYSTDAPSDFTDFDFAKAPWITPERLRRAGMLIVCEADEKICRRHVQDVAVFGKEERRLAATFLGLRRPDRTIVFFLVAPNQAGANAPVDRRPMH